MFIGIICEWGISSNGRARTLHARSSGIDARILHFEHSALLLLFSLKKRNEINISVHLTVSLYN